MGKVGEIGFSSDNKEGFVEISSATRVAAGGGGLDELELGEGLLKPLTDDDFEVGLAVAGIGFNVTGSGELVVEGSGSSEIEVVGRSEGILEDEGELGVLEEGDEKLGEKGLGSVSESVMGLGVVALEP